MSYAIAETFKTLQGEGALAGTCATFVRFAGCNLWSGQPDHRQRDADRHGALCPAWCDTDFNPRHRVEAREIAEVVENHAAPLVVFTGGEPLLQLDAELLQALPRGVVVAVETNGTIMPKDGVWERLDHVCVSPKVPEPQIVLREGTELKVVYPAYNPLAYLPLAMGFEYLFVSPLAETVSARLGASMISADAEVAAARFCMDHPEWRLSLQSHKHIGLP